MFWKNSNFNTGSQINANSGKRSWKKWVSAKDCGDFRKFRQYIVKISSEDREKNAIFFSKDLKNSKILQKFTKKASFAKVSQRNNGFSQKIMKKTWNFAKNSLKIIRISSNSRKKCTINIRRTFHPFQL